jgi:hypothetical protein
MDRFIFGNEEMMILVNIIRKKEGGRFWKALRERKVTKNMEKSEMWILIC